MLFKEIGINSNSILNFENVVKSMRNIQKNDHLLDGGSVHYIEEEQQKLVQQFKTNKELMKQINIKPNRNHQHRQQQQLHQQQILVEEIEEKYESKVKTGKQAEDRRREYKDVELLGEGTYGTVKLIQHKGSQKLFACKQMEKELIEKMNMEDYLNREIVIHSSLKHKHICKIEEILYLETSIDIIMEYCSEGTLESVLEPHNTLSERVARKYFTQMTEAIIYIHSKGIIHRDLQLGNICIDHNDDIKIIDFGLSTFVTDNKKPVGHGKYICPEMQRLQPYSGKADVFALGVCLFKMLTGYYPFRLSKYALEGKFSVDLEEEENISEEAKDLLQKLLQNNQEKRIDSFEILHHQWMLKQE